MPFYDVMRLSVERFEQETSRWRWQPVVATVAAILLSHYKHANLLRRRGPFPEVCSVRKLFFVAEEETRSTRNFLRDLHKSRSAVPTSVTSLRPSWRQRKSCPRSRNKPYLLRSLAPTTPMSPPAMAPVLGSGAKEYKRESGSARLLGSGTVLLTYDG